MADLTTLLSQFLYSRLPLFNGGPSGILTGSVSTTLAGTAANTDEQTLYAFSLPASTLGVNGRGVRIRAFGTVAANGNTKTVKLKFGSTIIATRAAADNGQTWTITADVIRTSATAQLGHGWLVNTGGSVANQSITTPAETLSGAVTISLTGQSGTGTASDVVFRGAYVELIG